MSFCFSFSLVIFTSHPLFIHAYHFPYFPSHFLCSFFPVHTLYIFFFVLFVLRVIPLPFYLSSLWGLRSSEVWRSAIGQWVPPFCHIPMPWTNRHGTTWQPWMPHTYVTRRWELQYVCCVSILASSCLALLFSFWRQHLFWEINLTFNTSRILSEFPKNKNCPVYLVPDHSSCIAQKAWISPTDPMTLTVLSHTLKQTHSGGVGCNLLHVF
jgi:hypothetical protein